MDPIRVNADYESVLFHQKPGPLIVNQSLEFLAFFLSDAPLLTQKKYDQKYLQHVEMTTGRRPLIVTQSEKVENWWGRLEDLAHERWMNSKLTSAELHIKEGWLPDLKIVRSSAEMDSLPSDWILKDPFGMSGRGITKVSLATHPKYPVIAEPLLERVYDFSFYHLNQGEGFHYQNLVDRHFQYRGTIFLDRENLGFQGLKFFNDLPQSEWEKYEAEKKRVLDFYQLKPYFSLDSFVYRQDGKLRIRSLSEVNYRKTMGLMAHQLSQKYAHGSWSGLFLVKTNLREELYSFTKEVGGVLLSPADVRFQMILLSAVSAVEGELLLEKLKKLLSDSEFSINI
jgi:hypothetical protein